MVCGTCVEFTCARFRWYWHSSGMVFTSFCCATDDANFWSSRHIIEDTPWDELVVSDLNLNNGDQHFFLFTFFGVGLFSFFLTLLREPLANEYAKWNNWWGLVKKKGQFDCVLFGATPSCSEESYCKQTTHCCQSVPMDWNWRKKF